MAPLCRAEGRGRQTSGKRTLGLQPRSQPSCAAASARLAAAADLLSRCEGRAGSRAGRVPAGLPVKPQPKLPPGSPCPAPRLACHAVRLVHYHQRQRHARAQRLQQVRVAQALGADKQQLDAPRCHVGQHLPHMGGGGWGSTHGSIWSKDGLGSSHPPGSPIARWHPHAAGSKHLCVSKHRQVSPPAARRRGSGPTTAPRPSAAQQMEAARNLRR